MTLCLPFQLCSGMFFSTEMAKKMLVLLIEMQLDIFIKIGFGDYFFMIRKSMCSRCRQWYLLIAPL